MASIKTPNDHRHQNRTTLYDAQSFSNGETIMSTPGALLKLVVSSKSNSALWLALFGSTTAGTSPLLAPISVPAGSTVAIDLQVIDGDGWCGVDFSALTWAASSAAVFSQDSTNSMWLSAIITQ